ncbi:MAG: hypothetical protein NZ553_04445 [Caldilinea sp.]|nr:hypothetical protein [Caldilinea sp.]MDW8439705.1 hypothetical protein [Caldilineaceae bacterium]
MFPYMFPQNELLMVETARERRQKLMQEACGERLFRRGRPLRASWVSAVLAALGRRMVRWGQQLERRSHAQVDSASTGRDAALTQQP